MFGRYHTAPSIERVEPEKERRGISAEINTWYGRASCIDGEAWQEMKSQTVGTEGQAADKCTGKSPSNTNHSNDPFLPHHTDPDILLKLEVEQ